MSISKEKECSWLFNKNILLADVKMLPIPHQGINILSTILGHFFTSIGKSVHQEGVHLPQAPHKDLCGFPVQCRPCTLVCAAVRPVSQENKRMSTEAKVGESRMRRCSGVQPMARRRGVVFP